MNDFRLGKFPNSSILYVYARRSLIWFDPPYQRMGDVWPRGKRQDLIDSVINGYDLPKFYFHEFYPRQNVGDKSYDYAIIDGKQRLESLFAFIDGAFGLADDFEYVADPALRLEGLTYAQLANAYPLLKAEFDGFVLDIVTIKADDMERVEDMFSRLNEATPLNAAEKRNALGGPVPQAVRQLAQTPFFRSRVPFDNKRYRHFDLAVKFLLICHKGALVDTKKVYLDSFVRDQRAANGPAYVAGLQATVSDILNVMSTVFTSQDPLLNSVGTLVLYFFLFMSAEKEDWQTGITREELERFENAKRDNRNAAITDMAKADYGLLEYDRLALSPNDSTALNYRYRVLRQSVGPAAGRPSLPWAE